MGGTGRHIHRIVCRGCGLPLPPQLAKQGNMLRYHDGCRVVARHWNVLFRKTLEVQRYRRLRHMGIKPSMAAFGCTSDGRYDAVLKLEIEP